MTAAVLLYTMRCNIACAHCSVDSHPGRREKMSLATAVELVAGLADTPGIEFVDISGGEAMLFRRELLELGRAAADAGISLRIVSNGYWATSAERASRLLGELQANGVSSVGLSIDIWHRELLDPARVGHYLTGCRSVGMQPLMSGVLAPDKTMSYEDPFPAALVELLAQYGIDRADCLDVYTWADRRSRLTPADQAQFDRLCAERVVLVAWQPLTGEGRAVNLEVHTRRFAESEPEPCGAAGNLPTIDEAGRLFPCCAPWISRKDHALAIVSREDVAQQIDEMRRDPLVRVIHERGPQVLIDWLRADGYAFADEHSGICNQCGMLLDTVPLPLLRSTAQSFLDTAR